ncbi:MAG: class I SAM-dependent methyltransferase [Vulcanimicrobiota bacterium]
MSRNRESNIHAEHQLIRDVYDRRSSCYNTLIEILSLGRDLSYRREAVQRLSLKRGDRVLDLGCGTGLNFPLILERIGDEGALVAVDSSCGMLDVAKKWLDSRNVKNVSLVAGDVTEALFRAECFDALISTYLFSTVIGWRESLEGHLGSLRIGGIFVFADDILPAGWFAGPLVMLKWLKRYGWLNNSRELVSFVKEKGDDFRLTSHHLGMIFVVSGKKTISSRGCY